MGFLLGIKGFSIVIELEVGMGDSLVATSHLDVVLTKKVDVSVQTFHEAINGRLMLLKILVHQT